MESEGERPVSVRRLLEQAELDLDDDDWFGDYRIVGPLGHGGMGAVFEAEAPNFGPRVALKRLLEPQLASESEERRFLFGAEAQSRLNHPHIVQVLHVGKCRGRAFFTMELVGGGRSLRKRLEEAQRASDLGRPRFDKADFHLLAKVAAGVAHAHDSGLLHRDLKPENILLEGDEPQIADFGLAKELDTEEMLTEPGWVMGTVPYMSPEQAAGRPLTQSSDLYSLGAILYEVVTGRRQFDDGERSEQRQRITSSEPVLAPRAIDPSIPEEVERVCLKCLEKDPSRRYLDASTLSRDLESLAESKPTSLPPPRGFARATHILRRHPARVKKVLRVAIVVFTLVAAAGYALVSRARAERTALDMNAFIATAQAGAALYQFREFADRMERAAQLPEIQALAQAQAVVDDPPQSLKDLSVGFDAAFVVTKAGYVSAQWPIPPHNVWSRWYGFRDYFLGASELGKRGTRGVYVGRAFRSERDGQIKFGVSAPLFLQGEWAGVLVAAIPANPVFGRVRMRDESDGNRITALIGPRDVDRNQAKSGAMPSRHVILIHQDLGIGDEIIAPNNRALQAAVGAAGPPGRQFSLPAGAPLTDPDYRDPVRGFEGSWNAAFAPVGGTGFVIVVQSRR